MKQSVDSAAYGSIDHAFCKPTVTEEVLKPAWLKQLQAAHDSAMRTTLPHNIYLANISYHNILINAYFKFCTKFCQMLSVKRASTYTASAFTVGPYHDRM